jgi:hypothetical protein
MYLVALTGCGASNTDYYAEISYVFVNDTDKTISIYNTEDPEELADNEILIMPHTRDTIEIQGDSGEILDPEICCGDLLRNNIYGANSGKSLVKIDDLTCEIESLANIENYTYEQPSARVIHYTFTFTEEVLNEKINCKN